MRNLWIVGVVALALFSAGCQQLKSRDQLNKGVQAFKSAQYPEAVEHFKTAVELEPDFAVARLYLATAYMQQYIPGAVSPENNQMAAAAHDQFMKVLEKNPTDKVAIASIASLYLNQSKWDEAKQWYEKLIAVSPDNADAYYSLGFIAWSQWYPELGKAKAALGMKQEDPGPIKDKKVKEELREKYLPIVDAGLAALDKALAIKPDYDDAMAYENLLVREKADLANSKEEYEQQIKVADDWFNKTVATRKDKAEKKGKGPGGISMDQTK
ncbi:MAG TPA: tetratricopeptide repeat protein [Bryobacteraceae bacterium]|nr:tetratricopeptide repeat protein [Bryobacteraceae bacterium]